MQHLDRTVLAAAIGQLVSELYGGSGDDERAAALAARLQPLLDTYLSEVQPIRSAEVTLLLADIRGFTALTQALPPAHMATLLNRFFTRMCTVIARNGGVVDKFLGDAILALFGAPQRRPDDVPRALACAVEMQQELTAMNRTAAARGEPSVYAGIAVTTGPVMLGSFGSAVHREYTVVGDAVNLVSRIESFSLRGQVLLSEGARAAAGAAVETGRVNEVRVKGMAGPVVLHELLAVTQPRRLVLPRVETRRSPRIGVDLAALFHRVAAKRILPGGFPGQVHDLGYEGMGAVLPVDLPKFAEVAIALAAEAPPGSAVPTGLYSDGRTGESIVFARVLRTRATDAGYRTSLEFTTVDTPGHRRLKLLVDDALWRR